MLLTRCLVCGFEVLALFILSDTRKNSKKGLFLWHGKTLLAFQREGLKRRSRTALSTLSMLSSEPGKEMGDPGRSYGVIPGGEELAECWVCAGRGLSVRSSPPRLRGIISSSQCHWSKTEFSMVSLCCLHLHLHLHKRISYPLDRQTELHKVKSSPLIKVTVKESNLLGVFFSSRIMGFILK